MKKNRRKILWTWGALATLVAALLVPELQFSDSQVGLQSKAPAKNPVDLPSMEKKSSALPPSPPQATHDMRQLSYRDELRGQLLAGMPRGTRVEVRYRSSFFAGHSQGKGHELRDLLLVETILPNGQKYAYNASYSPRTQNIVRTWGGHHDMPSNNKFTPPPIQ